MSPGPFPSCFPDFQIISCPSADGLLGQAGVNRERAMERPRSPLSSPPRAANRDRRVVGASFLLLVLDQAHDDVHVVGVRGSPLGVEL